jgi:AbiTii
MSLLADIQSECVAREASISRILRLCLQLAARLKHDPLKEWALHELNGYSDGVDLPAYRVFETRSVGFFADFMHRVTLDIPMNVVDEPLRTKFSTARLDQPISQYEDLLGAEGEGSFRLPWPMELTLHYGPKISEIQCIKIWQELPQAALSGLIDTVKTRVLSMVLAIESENPDAGDIRGAAVPIPEAKVTQIFNTNITGSQVQNLAAGSTGVAQTAGNQIAAGDEKALTQYLASIGIAAAESAKLLSAIEQDKEEGSTGIGNRAAEWLKTLRAKANDVGGEIAKHSVALAASHAILEYLGLS